MGKGVARLNDETTGVCYHPSHLVPFPTKGNITSASTDNLVDNRGIARKDDRVTTGCGHTDYIISGSAMRITNGRQTARLDDPIGRDGIYIATITTASTSVIADE